MKRWSCHSMWLFLFAASAVIAQTPQFQIEQIYSNSDCSVQFIVLHEITGNNAQNFLGGQTITSSGGNFNQTFTFRNNLPNGQTGNRRVLIGSQGFAALGVVTPDYVMPNCFIPVNGGSLTFNGVNTVNFSALPVGSGTTAITASGTNVPNLATNFAGQTGSVSAFQAALPAATIVPVAGVWWNPNEPGSGYGIDYQNGVVIIEVYSYLPSGASQWYLAAGPVVNNVFTGTLDMYTNGQCISCTYKNPGPPVGNAGTITVTFTSPTTAIVDLPGGRHFQIQRFFS
jgi:hypothetical protein